MILLIVLGLLWLAVLIGAVACCGGARVEDMQTLAGVRPARKTTGKL